MLMNIMNTLRNSFRLALALSLLAASLAQAQPERIDLEYLAVLRTGDKAALEHALRNGASPNARDSDGNTPLMHAAVYGNAAVVQLLLDRGADVNAVNAAGATPLMRAAFDVEKVALLLDRGAKVDHRSALGNTALMLAARPRNSYSTVKLLLEHKADPLATNLFGATALMAAAAGGDAASVRLLLEHGAKADAQPGIDPGSFLLGGGRSALMWAAFRGDSAIMNLLIDAGANVNSPGFLGTPLAQAAWSDHTAASQVLLDRGADPNGLGPFDGYAPLHWAASTEQPDPALVKLLIERGADPNLGGGEHVDAFMGTLQTPLMLARRRGDTPVAQALVAAGALKATPDRPLPGVQFARQVPDQLDPAIVRAALSQAIPPLQETAIESKGAFMRHESRQDCISCHQQMLPMAAIGLARKQQIPVDQNAERALIQMVREGDFKDLEVDLQPLFHPEPAHSKGYTLLALAAEDLPADARTDAWVHHLSVVQGQDGQWHNNLPRPPLQTDDIGATALAVHALQRYPLPGRKSQLAAQVDRARRWLRSVEPRHNEGRAYQILGLAWAGEPPSSLTPMVDALISEQRADGGWAQLPGLNSDAYATGQAIYALRVGGRLDRAQPAVDRGLRYLLGSQLSSGVWHVRRRAFPFQPTMNSGFPHGRDSWISAAASSWAVMALSVPDEQDRIALQR